jgi:hypothetical protein
MDVEGGAHEGVAAEGGAESSGGDNARAMDPWKDRSARPISVTTAPAAPGQLSQSPQQANRLSFDPASGVIILPEDDWFFDSDDDYGDSTPTPGGTSGGGGSEHTGGGTDGAPSPTSPVRQRRSATRLISIILSEGEQYLGHFQEGDEDHEPKSHLCLISCFNMEFYLDLSDNRRSLNFV